MTTSPASGAKGRGLLSVRRMASSRDGDDIIVATQYGEVTYQDHATYLWCASTDNPNKPTHILTDPNSKGVDKRPLDVKTILDWLLSLPSKYNKVTINHKPQNGAIFVMFGSGYHITQILCKTSLKTAHNIVRRVDYDDDSETLNAREFWGEYAFSYMKGKWLDIWRLRDPDHPIRLDGKLDAIEHITLFDTFGYFQKKFEDVVTDMLKRGMATEYEKALITKMKAKRGIFKDVAIEKITEYCLTECMLLSKEMAQIRWACYNLELRPNSWHGPGAIANASTGGLGAILGLIERKGGDLPRSWRRFAQRNRGPEYLGNKHAAHPVNALSKLRDCCRGRTPRAGARGRRLGAVDWFSSRGQARAQFACLGLHRTIARPNSDARFRLCRQTSIHSRGLSGKRRQNTSDRKAGYRRTVETMPSA